jgi:hypothetical protein
MRRGKRKKCTVTEVYFPFEPEPEPSVATLSGAVAGGYACLICPFIDQPKQCQS